MRNREEVKSLKWKVGDRKMTNLKIYDKVLKLRMFICYTSLQKTANAQMTYLILPFPTNRHKVKIKRPKKLP